MNISVLGAATTKFGELWGVSPKTLAHEVAMEAITQAGIKSSQIDALYVGNMLSGMLGGQEHLGAFFAEALGLGVPAFKIEGACASGGLALHTAIHSVRAGVYETVMVLGVEKMTDHKPEDVSTALMGAASEEERLSGLTFPGLYAMLARVHMKKFGTTEEELAHVAVKNHLHALSNPNAQFHSRLTVEKVLQSSNVADPIKLLDCSPISDGAAAVVISSNKGYQKNCTQKPITIVASEVATDTLGLAQRTSLTELRATKEAAQRAYGRAHLSPKDIDVAEVHDCFTIAEILAIEDLGFFEKGRATKATVLGETTLGRAKTTVVNPSGGLKGCGHPVGATGVKQVVELTEQLRGKAGSRQVEGAYVGLAHNVGGSGASAVVHILKG